MQLRKLIFIIVTFFVSTSFAVVDMKNANYADTWLDLIVPGSGFDLRIQRTYNSRSLFNGIFGFGWCSDFETKIEITAEGNIELTECGGGLKIVYYPKSFKANSVSSTVNKIIKKVKARNASASKKYLDTLKNQLLQDSELRSVWAKDVGIAKKGNKSGTTYFANGREVEKISFTGKYYERSLPDSTKQRFDLKGRLIAIYDKNRNYIKINYASDVISEVVDNSGRRLRFKFFPNKKVKEILGPNGLKVQYRFKSEDVVKVKNAWGNVYTYQYDTVHNLIKISYPDKTFKSLTYDQRRDWVMSFRDRNGCTESYSYLPSRDDPKNHYTSSAVKKCKGKVVNQAKHEFWHKKRKDGRKFLSRVKTKNKKESLDVVYHEVFGKPVSIRRNGDTTTFSYYPNGLVKVKATKFSALYFKYKNKYQKVSEVTAELYNNRGKVAKKRVTRFKYDSKANLIFAKNTDGQEVRLKYDTRGRIASIVDQAKKEVRIKYEERFGKPAKITRTNLGTIKVSYKPNGEIKKVESPEGTTVAVQVASTFNNLLDVIAPATNELSL